MLMMLNYYFEKNIAVKSLVKCVVTIYAVNLNKTKYMIFSRQNSEKNLPAPLKISGTKIEHEHETCFLGVIMDEKLTWANHFER